MNIVEYVAKLKSRAAELEGQRPEFCSSTGVNYWWLTKFAQGQLRNPTVAKLRAFEEALRAWDAAKAADAPHDSPAGTVPETHGADTSGPPPLSDPQRAAGFF